MNVTIPLAVGSGWWIAMPVCMLMMMMMMFAMMGHGGAKNRAERWWSSRWPGPREEAPAERGETPIDVLDRRFAEGEISLEDYRERREALTNVAARAQVGASTNDRSVASQATRKEQP